MAIACAPESVGGFAFLAVVPIAGLPIFDTILVAVSRYRRHVTILTGGTDHVTHRLHRSLATPARVAIVLVLIQGVLSLFAIGLHGLDSQGLAEASAAYLLLGCFALTLIEGSFGKRRPEGKQPASSAPLA
jgi:hypothetical protein